MDVDGVGSLVTRPHPCRGLPLGDRLHHNQSLPLWITGGEASSVCVWPTWVGDRDEHHDLHANRTERETL